MGKPVKIPFPRLGVNKGAGTSEQPYATSSEMSNVRLYDVLSKRARGGQRPGQTPWGDGDLIGDSNQPVVAMCTVSSIV